MQNEPINPTCDQFHHGIFLVTLNKQSLFIAPPWGTCRRKRIRSTCCWRSTDDKNFMSGGDGLRYIYVKPERFERLRRLVLHIFNKPVRTVTLKVNEPKAVATNVAPKTVLITGNTYPVKEQLKSLGAKWDRFNKGWRVPAVNETAARRLVNNAPRRQTSGSSGSVSNVYKFNSGHVAYRNKAGRCEDAPCCGCCTI